MITVINILQHYKLIKNTLIPI